MKENLYRILLTCFSFLPFKYNGITHKIFSFILADIIGYRKKVIETNIKNSFPEYNSDKVNSISSSYYKILVAYIFETIQIYTKDKIFFDNKIKFINPEVLDKDKTRSNIIIGSHYGNWEWTSLLLPFHSSKKTVALYKPLSNKILDKIVKEKRERFGLELLSIDEAIRKISKETENKSYIFVSDQSPANANSGKWLTFLEQHSLFYEGPAVIAKKYGMNVFYQQVEWKEGKYIVTFLPITDEDVISRYVSLLEHQIKQVPEFWLWSHKRWKHQKKV